MKVIAPDFDRRIDLPGVGLCPRPVDIDQQVTGFGQLVSLRIYSFAADSLINGDAEGDELVIALLRGEATVAVAQDGVEVAAYPLRLDATRAVFLPPGASYRLSMTTDGDVAYARVLPRADTAAPVAAFSVRGGQLDIADHASGMAVALSSLVAGEAFCSTQGAERLVHHAGGGDASIGDARLCPWQTVALDPGDAAAIVAGDVPVELLVVTARAG